MYGKIILEDYDDTPYPYAHVEMIWQNDFIYHNFSNTTGFDGEYDLYVDPGIYQLSIKKDSDFSKKIKLGTDFDFKPGEIYEINITAQSIRESVTIEYSNERAWRKAQLLRKN